MVHRHLPGKVLMIAEAPIGITVDHTVLSPANCREETRRQISSRLQRLIYRVKNPDFLPLIVPSAAQRVPASVTLRKLRANLRLTISVLLALRNA